MRVANLAPLVLSFSTAACALGDEVEKEDRKGTATYSGGGATFVVAITDDYQRFKREWAQPAKDGLPKIQTSTNYSIGDTLFPIVLYHSTNVNAAGSLDIEYDMSIEPPSGHDPEVVKRVPVRKGQPLPRLRLAETTAAYRFDEGDPTGRYRVTITVRDRVGSVEKKFRFHFDVHESDSVNK